MRPKLLCITITLILGFAVTGFADKQDKILVCHVDSDVGKIDLISVADSAKHIDNPNHSFNGVADYEPSAMGASGVGTEDSDGNGVDDGCEPLCPCFTYEQVSAIANKIPGADDAFCFNDDDPNNYVRQNIQVLVGDPPVNPYEEWSGQTWASKWAERELGCEYRDYKWDGSTSIEILVDWTGLPTDENWQLLQACVDIIDEVWVKYGLPVTQTADCD